MRFRLLGWYVLFTLPRLSLERRGHQLSAGTLSRPSVAPHGNRLPGAVLQKVAKYTSPVFPRQSDFRDTRVPKSHSCHRRLCFDRPRSISCPRPRPNDRVFDGIRCRVRPRDDTPPHPAPGVHRHLGILWKTVRPSLSSHQRPRTPCGTRSLPTRSQRTAGPDLLTPAAPLAAASAAGRPCSRLIPYHCGSLTRSLDPSATLGAPSPPDLCDDRARTPPPRPAPPAPYTGDSLVPRSYPGGACGQPSLWRQRRSLVCRDRPLKGLTSACLRNAPREPFPRWPRAARQKWTFPIFNRKPALCGLRVSPFCTFSTPVDTAVDSLRFSPAITRS